MLLYIYITQASTLDPYPEEGNKEKSANQNSIP